MMLAASWQLLRWLHSLSALTNRQQIASDHLWEIGRYDQTMQDTETCDTSLERSYIELSSPKNVSSCHNQVMCY